MKRKSPIRHKAISKNGKVFWRGKGSVVERRLKSAQVASRWVDKAINEIRELGTKNPFLNSTLLDDGVEVEFYPDVNGNGIHLSSISSVNKGQGNATKAMERICKIADKWHLPITMIAKQFGRPEDAHKRLTTNQLVKWYKKFGFKKVKDSFGDSSSGYEMIREQPKALPNWGLGPHFKERWEH